MDLNTAGAMATYARRVAIPWRLVAPGMAAAGIAASSPFQPDRPSLGRFLRA